MGLNYFKGIGFMVKNNKYINDSRVHIGSLVSAFFILYLLLKYVNSNNENTDNAIVRCDIIDVVSEINGVIEQLHFKDNFSVEKGALLVTLRDSMYKNDLSLNSAELRSAKNALNLSESNYNINKLNIASKLEGLRASFNTSVARLNTARLEVEEIKKLLEINSLEVGYSNNNLNRLQSLVSTSSVSQREFDEAETKHKLLLVNNEAILVKLKSKESNLETYKSLVEEAKVKLDLAKESSPVIEASFRYEVSESSNRVSIAKARLKESSLYLKKTKIHALRAGSVTNRRISEGDFIEIGQPIASLTSCEEEIWVEANFKETQIGKMKHGQKVDIHVDAYPHKIFKGSVESISTGSGSIFSVLPPENATGNFTKVVQRFPVKISIDSDTQNLLKIGMSTEVTVHLK